MTVPVTGRRGGAPVAHAPQRTLQLLLEHPLDERPDLLPNTRFQRIKPIRSQHWHLFVDSDILLHGVISADGANRRFWGSVNTRRLRQLQFPPTQRRDRAMKLVPEHLVDHLLGHVDISALFLDRSEQSLPDNQPVKIQVVMRIYEDCARHLGS